MIDVVQCQDMQPVLDAVEKGRDLNAIYTIGIVFMLLMLSLRR